jgi:RNA polymerase sigma-70 factor, ECF subfamily
VFLMMDASERQRLEEVLRRAFDAGDLGQVATLALTGYGAEIMGYLVGVLRSPGDADEVFGELCVDLWSSLSRFRWECSLRAWAYTLARHRAYAFGRDPARRAVPLSSVPELADVAAQVRTATRDYLRTEVKDRVARLREQLDDEERTLLILRVDRDLSWAEIALILEVGEPTLRKRFERVKIHLRELADADAAVHEER